MTKSATKRTARIWAPLLALLLPFVLGAQRAVAQASPSLTQLEFDIVGLRLDVSPTALTVPRDIPTIINADLTIPAGATPQTQAALDELANGAEVHAELRGPGIPPIPIVVQAGQPIPIPALALPGDYFLEQIRLVKNGQVVLDGTPNVVPIAVIRDLIVTSVTTTPLSLDEIVQKGIVIDQNNFTAFNFQVGFTVDGVPFTIRLPVAHARPDQLRFLPGEGIKVQELLELNRDLAQLAEIDLPPQFKRPGLNFGIAALPFIPGGPDDNNPLPFGTPPITGLVIIPGNVAFLNQHFSMMLLVSNAAPGGTALVLRDLEGEISLPPGLDHVLSSDFANPGDDPLRLARIAGVGQVPIVPIVQAGPDDTLGTADDIPTIGPQEMGDAEFLVEGLREGAHDVEFEIRAVLDGLPSGPLHLVGNALGAVFVRNPTFSITLGHPRTVRTGEKYDLFATVTNTSQTPANLVSINLDPRSISGAILDPNSDPSVQFQTLPPGESRTGRFTLIAQKTGEVTFGSFTSDPGLTGRFNLRTGIGERGVALAPNAIVLPSSADALPDDLVFAAVRVLGQALSVATAPTLPPDVLYIPRSMVVERGRQLGEAGLRVDFGEPVERVVRDLLLDWMGSTNPQDGFDQLLRETEAGASFAAAVGRVLNGDVVAATVLDAQEAFAQSTAPRAPHISAIVGQAAGGAPVALRLGDGGGRAAGQGETSLPFADVYALQDVAGARAQLGVISQLPSAQYVVEVLGTGSGDFDLGLVFPTGVAELTQLRYEDVPIEPGGVARVVIALTGPTLVDLQVDTDGDGVVDAVVSPTFVTLQEAPPQIVAVRQLASSFLDRQPVGGDPAAFGLLVGVLFDKPVEETSAEDFANVAVEDNRVIGTALQPGGRLLRLYLQKPIGTLVDRQITLQDVADLRGNLLSPHTQVIDTVLDEGGEVFGQVLSARGDGIDGAILNLTIVSGNSGFSVSTIVTRPQGEFNFDFVPTLGSLVLTAQNPADLDFATATAKLRGPGQRLLLNPTFRGRGLVRGRVFEPDGVTPRPNALVRLAPAEVHENAILVNANALGEFVVTDAPVGAFNVWSKGDDGAYGEAAGFLPAAGGTADVDIVLATPPSAVGRVIGRAFLADGATPADGFRVMLGVFSSRDFTMRIVDETTSDTSGSFALESIPPGSYDVVALDTATGDYGVTSFVAVSPGLTTSVNVLLRATGAVEGVVLDAQGQLVPGAVIAGGRDLGTADANGFFRIDGVPPGKRTIQAGNPITLRRGAADVTVLSGQTVFVQIQLEARATIVGQVTDAAGNPVPNVTVRLPTPTGYTFVFANNGGFFRFPDLMLKSHLIQAPGPSQRSLIDQMIMKGQDPCRAFTAIPPDIPSDLSCGVPSPFPGTGTPSAAQVTRALQQLVGGFVSQGVTQPPTVPLGGGFGWAKAALFQDSVTVVKNLQYLPVGNIDGLTVDGNDLPTAATVRLSALTAGELGLPKFGELARLSTDPQTGSFAFGGIPLFDLRTFQETGIKPRFTLEALNPFSPALASFQGQLNANNPNLSGIILKFPPVTDTNGTVTGMVFLPDGVTPAPAGVEVKIGFGDLTVRTDAQGRFENLFPIPEGPYTLTATDPLSGLTNQIGARVPAGGNVDVQIRLLGLGAVSVEVERPDGSPVVGADVDLVRGGYPGDTANLVTDAAGAGRFDNITEGYFAVMAEEVGTGLEGRASGIVVRGGDVSVVVTLRASGTVNGTFVETDGITPIANASVEIRAGSIRAYDQTDANGRFGVLAIPTGSFVVTAVDPVSGRRGRASGQLRFEGDVADVTVVQGPRGTVRGFALDSDGHTTLPGATVSISSGDFERVRLDATTRPDGSFEFDGIPEGAFTLDARDPLTGFMGSAGGAIRFDGEVVDVDVLIEPFNAIRVRVVDVDGVTPVPNAALALTTRDFTFGRSGAADVNGEATFEFLRLATYDVVARSLADLNNGGVTTVTLDQGARFGACVADPGLRCRDDSDCPGADTCDTPGVDALIQLRGTGTVDVTVLEADGVTPADSARVTLRARGRTAGETGPLSFGTDFVRFTDAQGQVSVPSVPFGDFDVTAELGTVAGVAQGTLPAHGAIVPVSIVLGPSGSVQGRVLLPDGMTLAAQTLVTATFNSQSGLQSGVLQLTTDLTGAFSFAGIPVGTFDVSAFEQTSNGVRRVAGAITFNQEVVDLGDLVLDNVSPRVVAVTPADGSRGAPVATDVVIDFNEPIAPLSVSSIAPSPNVLLTQGSTQVPGTLALSNGEQTLTFTPLNPLLSEKLYTLTILAVPNGPRDREGLELLDPFVSSFTTADIIPPTLVSRSPGVDQRQLLLDAVVRLTFSEAIASGASFELRDDAGVLVQTAFSTALGGTVAILSPTNFLQPNRRYTVLQGGVADLAGNPLAGGASSYDFYTVDTIAPTFNGLLISGTPSLRAGTVATIVPDLASTDVDRVEYRVDGVPVVSSVAPFAIDIALPAGQAAVSVQADAFDFAGNRSSATLMVPVTANQAPVVTSFTSSCGTSARQGDVCSFSVDASDEVALAQIVFSAQGAANASQIQVIPPATAQASAGFNLTIPATAPSGGSVTLRAVAVDNVAASSVPAVLNLDILDGLAPSVAITAPPNGSQVLPGQTVQVTVSASDDVGLTSVGLACTPNLAGCAVRPLGPPTTASVQVFSVDIPASAVAPLPIDLIASAVDSAGNTGTAMRTLQVVDLVPPSVLGLTSLTGSTRVVDGQSVSVRADVSDNTGVASVRFDVAGSVSSVPVAPAVSSGAVDFSFIVPGGAASPLVVTATALDASGNASAPFALALSVGDTAAPTLTISQPQPGDGFDPGDALILTVQASDDVAIARVDFTLSGAFNSSGSQPVVPAVTPATVNIPILVPLGTPAGNVDLSVLVEDVGGNPSAVALVSVNINDVDPPTVTIVDPTSGTQIDPRNPLDVTVTASDNVGVVSLTLGSETRTFTPAGNNLSEVFTITFATPPPTGQPLVLVAEALDAAGNLGSSPQVSLPVLDLVSPELIDLVPADGATDVSLAPVVEATFDQPIDPATVSAGTLSVIHPTFGPVAGTLQVTNGDQTLEFTPFALLEPSVAYTVELQGTILDASGNPVVDAARQPFASIVQGFTTSSAAISAPAPAALVIEGQILTVEVQTGPGMAPDSVTVLENDVPAALLPGPGPFTVDVVVPTLAQLGTPDLRIGAGLTAGANLSLEPGVLVSASSELAGFPATRAVDGDLDTSWFSQGSVTNQEFLEIDLPVDGTLGELRMFGNRQFPSGFDFASGVFEVLDSAGGVLFSSGNVALPAPDRDVAVGLGGVPGAARVRFTGTSGDPQDLGFAELEVLPGVRLPDVTVQVLPASGDQDGDGISNGDELLLGTDPFVADALDDPDGDTLTNLDELLLGTDPFNPDSDGDGLRDDVDPDPTAANPAVVGTSPVNGAIDVPRASPVSVEFSQPLDPTTAANLTLEAGGPLALNAPVLSAGDTIVTLTPASGLLPLGALVTVRVPTSVTNAAGLSLAPEFTASFTTEAADLEGPKVASLNPADGAVGVSLARAIDVVFSEPIDASTIDTSSFAVSDSGGPLAGGFSFFSANTHVRFTPSAPLPSADLITIQLNNAITDVVGNALVDAAGNPLLVPLSFSFTTASFSITSPVPGATVPENTQIQLGASGSASLGILDVIYTINGTPLPAAPAPAFSADFTTPFASATPQLTIVASARNASGVEVASDQVTVDVASALRFDRPLLGIVLGATRDVRLSLTAPQASDLSIVLTANDPNVLGLPVGTVVLPQGALEVAVPISGLATGNTTLTATTQLGIAAAVVSVGALPAGTDQLAVAPAAGARVLEPPSIGTVVLPAPGDKALELRLLASPAAALTPFNVTVADPTVVTVLGAVEVQAGAQVAPLVLRPGVAGRTQVVFDSGAGPVSLTIIVGAAGPNEVTPIVAPAVGAAVLPPPSVGAAILSGSGNQTVTVRILDTPAASLITVTTSVLDPTIVQIVGPVEIQPGSESATFTLSPGANGSTEILLHAGAGVTRSLTVIVGPPGPGQVPPIVAAPVGFRVLPAPSVGFVTLATSGDQVITVPILSSDAPGTINVAVTIADPSVVSVIGPVQILAGTQTATLTLRPGGPGTTTILLGAGPGVTRELTVFTGSPAPGQVPPFVAPSVGVHVRGIAGLGRALLEGGTSQTVTVQLLDAPAASTLNVGVTVVDPSVVSVGAVQIPAGSKSATFTLTPLVANGQTDVLLTAGVDVVRRLSVDVGIPVPGGAPTTVAPPVGVDVQ